MKDKFVLSLSISEDFIPTFDKFKEKIKQDERMNKNKNPDKLFSNAIRILQEIYVKQNENKI